MFPDVRRRRLPKLFLLVTGVVLTAAACGQDLGKSNFARTTVPATAATGQVPDGPITDPAVAAAVLRLVEPCQFLTRDALGALGLGTVEDDPTPSLTDYDSCTVKVKDPGGKEIRIALDLGSTLVPNADSTSGVAGGLPLRVRKDDETGCTIALMTSLNPEAGVLLSVTYPGDPCRPGRTVVDAIVQKLHGAPQKYPAPQGTLLTVDPCAAADTSAVAAAAPSPKPVPTALHGCAWRSYGTDPSVTVTFRHGLPPLVGDGYSQVDLGGGTTGYQKKGTTSTSECAVQWQHRPWRDDDVELAQVDYLSYGAKPAADDPCGKAVAVAKNVVTKLPRP